MKIYHKNMNRNKTIISDDIKKRRQKKEVCKGTFVKSIKKSQKPSGHLSGFKVTEVIY